MGTSNRLSKGQAAASYRSRRPGASSVYSMYLPWRPHAGQLRSTLKTMVLPACTIRRTVLRRVLAQAQIQRVLDEARRHHIIGSTHVSCKAAAILRCASNAGRAHLYYLHKSSSKCNQTSTSRGRTSQSCTTRKPKYCDSPFSLNLSQTKQQNAEFGI